LGKRILIMTTQKATCTDCSQSFTFEPITYGNKTLFAPTKCDPCTEKAITSHTEEVYINAKKASRNRFRQMIPPIYLDTRPERLSRLLTQYSEMWEYNPMGIGFVGMSGKGKTRAAVLLLERMHEKGKTTFFISATDLTLNAANQFADNPTTKDIAKSILTMTKSAEVLVLDDLGKGRMTDRAESELYDLLEYRTSRKFPTIWTSNSDSRGLHAMFSQDRADAIIRRLVEFSTIVKA
jgi:DNA replication protein DnaC